MKLDLTKFRHPLERVDREFQPDEVQFAEDAFRPVSPVILGFDVHKTGSRFRLVGRVAAELELTCSRCAEAFRLPVETSFDVRYEPESSAPSHENVELGEEDVETSFYGNDEIDLSDLMREQFYLTLPMKPLCFDECKGLCGHCGANLNHTSCECAPVWEDPRLAPLRRLGKTRDA
jgi:uncharacterized protein